AVRGALPGLRHVIVFDAGAAADGVTSLAQVEASGRAAAGRHPRIQQDARAVTPADLATLIYTSGTTGQPKGVMLTHGNICSNVRACLEVLRVSEGDSCLAWLPLSHILERMVEYYFFDVGVTINYAEAVDTVAQNLQEVRPSVVVAVPRLYEKVYARVPEIARFFYSAGLPVIEGYGLTETSPVLTLTPPGRPKLGAVGKPIPGVEIRIAADGEILAKGPNIMRGYYNLPDATREAIDADG